MTLAPSPPHLSTMYPSARVRGRLITRWEEQPLSWVSLDAETAAMLGRDQVGWFVSGHPGLNRAAEQLGRLDENPAGGIWVVVPYSGVLATVLRHRWPHPQAIAPLGARGTGWRSRRVWVAWPETLPGLLPGIRASSEGVAGVIVLDPPCILYQARGRGNDRPQHIVNFRAALDTDGWQPPLLLLTTQPAKAVNTEVVARAFCLNSFQFVAGDSFDCSEQTPEPGASPS
jgi:hypothetical protein